MRPVWKVIAFIGMLVPSAVLEGQPYSAMQHIVRLKEGLLVVVLPTQHKKIAELERLLSSPELSDRSRHRLSRILRDTRQEVATLQSALQSAFRDAYRFSQVAFVTDDEWRSRPLEALSLRDIKGAAVPLPTNGAVYFAALGRTDAQAGSSMEAMIIHDSAKQRLQRPFPYYARRYPPAAILDALLGVPDATHRHTQKMVARMNRKLFRYHQEVVAQQRVDSVSVVH